MTQTSPSPKPRVLVVENDARTADMHKQNLERWGYQPILATGVGEALLSDAQAKAEENACHIALVDMHLLDDYDGTDKSGLDLVSKLKPTLSIIVSGSGNNRQTVLEALNKEAIDFIGKEEPLIRLQGALALAKRQTWYADGSLIIDIADPLVNQIMNSLAPGKPEQVRDTLKMLFPEARALTVELLDGSARTPSVNLRRESYVLKVQPDDLQPFAVKLANVERIEREYENYRQYIEHRLGLNCYAEIVNVAKRWQIGGISYRFLGGGLNDFMLFSNYYAQHPAEELHITISYLFEHVWNPYISQSRPANERSLFNQFSLRWNREKWLERLDTYIGALGSELHQDELIGEFLDPVCWVRKRTGDWGRDTTPGNDVTTKFGQLLETVGHGDMQGDNFFVNQHYQTWMIDYERTGYGPVIQDFVLLEFDIWARLANIPNPMHFLELLCLMTLSSGAPPFKLAVDTQSQPEVQKARAVILEIRRLANRIAIDQRVYFWGILLNSVFRTVLLEAKITAVEKTEAYKRLYQELQRTKLVGAVICRRLDEWGHTWPPEEWRLGQQAPQEVNPSHSISSMPILFLTASPTNQPALQIEEELRAALQALAQQAAEVQLKLQAHGAVRLNELRGFLLKYNPCILHFAGHGNEQGEILLKDERGHGVAVPVHAFGEMLSILCDKLRCVILNACYTYQQASTIANYVDAVIVMDAQIEDRSAIAFTKGFYEALIYQRTLQTCFESGLNEIELQRLSGYGTPRLICRRSDPSKVHLL